MLEVPQDLLDERRSLDLDRLDELWDGELHMVPPPSFMHQRMETRLLVFFEPRLALDGIGVTSRGLRESQRCIMACGRGRRVTEFIRRGG